MNLTNITNNVLVEVERLRIESVAFPALGTGKFVCGSSIHHNRTESTIILLCAKVIYDCILLQHCLSTNHACIASTTNRLL